MERCHTLHAAGKLKSPDDLPVERFRTNRFEIDDLKAVTSAANFLKHADRDPDAAISEEDIGNLDIIARGCATYANLFKLISKEMDVYMVYWHSLTDEHHHPDAFRATAANDMRRLSIHERHELCDDLIRTGGMRQF